MTTAPAPVPEGLILPHAEALIRATGIEFRIGGERAFYSPVHDFIQVPRPEVYFEPINWHRTALHELAHASGHTSRLNRDLSGSFASKKYAYEEIVAEMMAMMLQPPTSRPVWLNVPLSASAPTTMPTRSPSPKRMMVSSRYRNVSLPSSQHTARWRCAMPWRRIRAWPSRILSNVVRDLSRNLGQERKLQHLGSGARRQRLREGDRGPPSAMGQAAAQKRRRSLARAGGIRWG